MFTGVSIQNDIVGPAAVDLDNGTLYINPHVWERLTPNTRKFVILHELAHNVGVMDESEADLFALQKLFENGSRLSTAINALYEALPLTSETDYNRIDAVIIAALEYEASEGNKQAKILLNEIGNVPKVPINAPGNVKYFVDQIISLIYETGSLIAGDSTTYQINDDGEIVEVFDTAFQSSVANATNLGGNVFIEGAEDWEEGDYLGWALNVFGVGLGGIYNYYKDSEAAEEYLQEQLDEFIQEAETAEAINTIAARRDELVKQEEAAIKTYTAATAIANEGLAAIEQDLKVIDATYFLLAFVIIILILVFL